MTKLQYLKQVLDKPIYGMPWFPKINTQRFITARLGKDSPPLHCPRRTTNLNNLTNQRRLYNQSPL